MDITRNWRLKMSRSQLLAARCPDSGAVILPQQTSLATRAAQADDVYQFDVEAGARLRAPEDESDFARAAR
ncbi:MAG: hypothetical protein JXJ20_13210 [Anaerolineae bacterium]|jgi:hypothetical protein|nr:hypothetical protein [Anaerolineae bacterium]